MSAPVVLVTRDASGQAMEFDWFEDERLAYEPDPIVVQTFDTDCHGWRTHSLRPTGMQLGMRVATVVQSLARNPWTDGSFVETHFWPEPGAPLEPIPGRAA